MTNDTVSKEDDSKPSSLAAPALGFAAGVLATIFGFWSGFLDREVKDREVDVEIMRIAFDVLQLPIDQSGPTYRNWACEVLDTHTGPDLDCDASDAKTAVLADLGEFREFSIGDRNIGDPTATDIALFVCDSAHEDRARQMAASLRRAGFGTIELRIWTLTNEVPVSELSGSTTIIYDADHPERNELLRIEEALIDLAKEPLTSRINTGPQSPWLISVIVCED